MNQLQNDSNARNTQLWRFQEDLIYGIDRLFYDKLTQDKKIRTIYFHERYRNLLVILSKDFRKIFDIRKLRLQLNNVKYRLNYQLENELIVSDNWSEQILVFANQEEKHEFARRFQGLIHKYRKLTTHNDIEGIQLFLDADISENNIIQRNELNLLLFKLKLLPTSYVLSILESIRKYFSKTNDDLQLLEFEIFMKTLMCKLELKELFVRYAKSIRLKNYFQFFQQIMTRKQFEYFLRTQQGQDIDRSKKISQKLFGQKDRISFNQFSKFVFSLKNSILDNKFIKRLDPQHYPLTHYYCFSSHNTYLTGNQITSDSRVERYLEDLEDGIRCVQLDVHNGDPEPIIKHGYTPTKSILFKDVVKVIAEFSNKNPDHTPIILSIENHCSVKNQDYLSQIFESYFKDQLTKQSKILKVDIRSLTYPTLAELRNKIIIKCTGKLVNVEQQDKQISLENSVVHEDFTTRPDRQELNDFKNKYINFQLRIQQLKIKKEHFLKHIKQFNHCLNIKVHQKINPKLSLKLVRQTSMLSSGSFGENICWQSISLDENKFQSKFNNNRAQLKKQAQNSWVRTYPSGTRILSNNYNPIKMLETGVQIIALNLQCKDIYTNILNSMFLKNKKQLGYKLKPRHLRQEPPSELKNQAQLTIKIISCHMLHSIIQLSPTIPPVQVQIAFFGSSQDMNINLNSGIFLPFTEKIQNNGFNPIFEQAREFKCKIKEMFFAFICFQIKDCGMVSIPARLIRPGYRIIPLNDQFMRQQHSYIFAHIKIQ